VIYKLEFLQKVTSHAPNKSNRFDDNYVGSDLS